jgi:hypothetical protein
MFLKYTTQDTYFYKEIRYNFLMNLERTTDNGKLLITRRGVIYPTSDGKMGIFPLQPCSFARTSLQATSVKYKPAFENGIDIPGEFVFYKSLPKSLEGCSFEFKEIYLGEDDKQIPIRQVLSVFKDGKHPRVFTFTGIR